MEQASAAAIVDTRGIVTGWSEGARRLTGHPAEDAVGRPVRELLAEDPPPEAVTALHGTVALRHRDGSTVSARLTACAVAGADGAPPGYVITAEAPEEPEEPEEPEPPGDPASDLAVQAFQQAGVSLSVLDTRQHYLRLNDMACRMMGVPEKALSAASSRTPWGRPYTAAASWLTCARSSKRVGLPATRATPAPPP